MTEGRWAAVDGALGVCVHTAWFALVCVGGPVRSPRMPGRARVEIAGDGLPAQAYHEAAESRLSVEDAGLLLDVVHVSSAALADAPVARAVATPGREAGPPWAADQKRAAATAISALGRGRPAFDTAQAASYTRCHACSAPRTLTRMCSVDLLLFRGPAPRAGVRPAEATA